MTTVETTQSDERSTPGAPQGGGGHIDVELAQSLGLFEALGVAARLAAAWDVPLVAACLVPARSTTEEVVAAETALEEHVVEVARATVRAIPADSLCAAAAAAAALHPFVVVPAPGGDSTEMVETMQAMTPVSGSSFLMIRAREAHSMEPWV